MAAAPDNVTPPSWSDANRDCLAKELQRIRLLMRRRVCWLRKGWREDALAAHRGPGISEARAERLLRGEDELSEKTFHQENPESQWLGREIEALENELARERCNLPSGGLTSLEVLLELFSLGDFERDALLVCYAALEDPEFGALLAYLEQESTAAPVTQRLLLGALCSGSAERAAARRLLAPEAPLRHFRLLEESQEHPHFAPGLRIPERVADFLRGLNRLDERVLSLLKPLTRDLVHGRHEQLVQGLVRWATGLDGHEWPILNLVGPPGVGKRSIAAEFGARGGVELFAIDVKRALAGDGERQDLWRLLHRESILLRIGFYADLTEADGGDRAFAAAVTDWLERFPATLFIASRERWHLEREMLHVDVPRLDATEQHQVWTRALDSVAHQLGSELQEIVQQFDFGPGAISRAVRSAAHRARTREGPTVIDAGDLWETCRASAGVRLGSLVERIVPGYCWDDIVLPDDLMQQVRELSGQVMARTQVYEKWGFGARLAHGRGIAALFSGPSGTGKTMTAEILANHLRLDLYRIDLAGVVSKYIGETEKNLRNIFDAAEQSGAILFFDEADALFGKRTDVRDSHDRYANIEVNYLLQRMEDYRGLAILCTNRRASLDRAFLRRLRFVIEFPFPDAQQRLHIWQKMFPAAAPLDSLDFAALARLEVPGGNIRNIALNAAFMAATAHEAITTAHVLHAARREYIKIEKLLTSAEFGMQFRQGAS